MDNDSPTGRFVVRDALTLTKLGTCICGYVESGGVRTGDELRWSDGVADRQTRCRGITIIRQVPPQDPPTMGLVVNDAPPSDFHAGMVISAVRPGARPSG